jgi:hypothetical protein
MSLHVTVLSGGCCEKLRTIAGARRGWLSSSGGSFGVSGWGRGGMTKDQMATAAASVPGPSNDQGPMSETAVKRVPAAGRDTPGTPLGHGPNTWR